MGIDVSTTLGIAGLVVGIASIVVAYRLRAKKRLSFRILSVRTILNIDQAYGLYGRLSATMDGRPLGLVNDKIDIVTVKIWNSGTEAISKQDFEGENYLSYGESYHSTYVLTPGVKVTSEDPSPMLSTFKDEGYVSFSEDLRKHHPLAVGVRSNNVVAMQDGKNFDKLLFLPLLFNKGDSIIVQTIVRNYGKFNMEAHIAGCDSPKEHKSKLSLFSKVMSSTFATVVKLILSITSCIAILAFATVSSTSTKPEPVTFLQPIRKVVMMGTER